MNLTPMHQAVIDKALGGYESRAMAGLDTMTYEEAMGHEFGDTLRDWLALELYETIEEATTPGEATASAIRHIENGIHDLLAARAALTSAPMPDLAPAEVWVVHTNEDSDNPCAFMEVHATEAAAYRSSLAYIEGQGYPLYPKAAELLAAGKPKEAHDAAVEAAEHPSRWLDGVFVPDVEPFEVLGSSQPTAPAVPSEPAGRIMITVSGGVADVDDSTIPNGVQVELRDYDCEGCEFDGHVDFTDDEGLHCHVAVYGAGEEPTPCARCGMPIYGDPLRGDNDKPYCHPECLEADKEAEDEEQLTRCDNCGEVRPISELDSITDLEQRIEPGGVVPAGQCPDCSELVDVGNCSQCNNCRTVFLDSELAEIKDLAQRLEPGGVVPSGECPHCGALCYPYTEEN